MFRDVGVASSRFDCSLPLGPGRENLADVERNSPRIS
jgi:hypothetical protein